MISDTIKSLRKQKGLSQQQIAIKLGVTQGAVSQWEIGLTEPGSDQLLELAKIFGVSVYEIKGKESPKQEKATPQITDEMLKFALFGGDEGITTADLEDVKRYADFVRSRKNG